MQLFGFGMLQLCWNVLYCTLDTKPKECGDMQEVITTVKVLLNVDLKRFAAHEQVELVQLISRSLHLLIGKYKVSLKQFFF